jgi:hypothetical protein
MSQQPAAWAPPPVLSDRNLAKVSAGLAWRRPPTERWQDKSRELRPVGRGRKHLSAHCSWTACRGTMRGARHCFDPKGDQKSKLSAARCATRALCPTDRRAPSHDRLGRAARRTAVGPQGSRYARPAPPACGLDRPAAARLFASKRSWLQVSDITPVTTQGKIGAPRSAAWTSAVLWIGAKCHTGAMAYPHKSRRRIAGGRNSNA